MGIYRLEALLLLPLLLGVVYLLLRNAQRAKQLLPRWFKPTAYTGHRPVLKNGLRIGGLSLLLVALAGPHTAPALRGQAVLGRQLYFLMDVSASMNVADVQPSRFEKAKAELRKLIPALQGEQLGLIAFTNYAYVQCPLTTDAQALELYLDLLSPNQFANQGTDLRTVLAQTAERFETERDSTQENITRAVVLLTDGQDFGKSYRSVLNRLQQLHIRLVPVGVGTAGGGPVPNLDEKGKPAGYKHTTTGAVAIAQLNPAPLQELAQFFGTRYTQLSSNNATLQPLLKALQQLPPSRLATRQELAAADVYAWPLALGLLCLVASLFLMPRKAYV